MRIVRAVVEWAAVLLVALGATLLLTSAAAYAECAWVLWAKDNVGVAKPEFTWSPVTSFQAGELRFGNTVTPIPVMKNCREEADKLMGNVKKRINNDGSETPEVTFHCFPDTVDPRSPKAR